MLLDTLEVADKIKKGFEGLKDTSKHKKVMKLVRERKAPCVRMGRSYYFKEQHVSILIDLLECSSSSKEEKPGIYAGLSPDKAYMKALERTAKNWQSSIE